jgi:predicted glycoside hydrolase/deacetylase ChbG (UPF0249 family)
MRVIVNADDLGASPEVNDAIFAMMALNRVSSATLMANGPAIDAALRDARRFPHCSFGIHLNLTQYAPLTRAPGLGPVLRDDELDRARLLRAPRVPSLLRAAFEEWSAQVARVRDAGLPVSHFDSHHHVHTMPFLLPALKALMARFGVRRVRVSKNLYTPAMRPPGRKLLEKAAFNAALRHALPRARTTRRFTEFQTFFDLAQADAGASFDTESIELMVHPGVPSDHFRHETELLAANPLADLAPAARLVAYHAI